MPRILKPIGTTLTEILVVLAILAILMAMLMPAVQRARKAANNTITMNDLRQIAVAYRNYVAKTRDRGPKKKEVLSPYYENSGRINEALDTKRITVIWDIPAHRIDSDTVLAYETNADGLGRRLVAMGDATVQTRDEHEFNSAIKAMQIVP
jgi:type II secretory pathway pseudopilin PulG